MAWSISSKLDSAFDPEHFLRGARQAYEIQKDFDRIFLNDINRKEWDSATTVFRQQLPDTAIINAVKKMPPEIYALNGKNDHQQTYQPPQ